MSWIREKIIVCRYKAQYRQFTDRNCSAAKKEHYLFAANRKYEHFNSYDLPQVAGVGASFEKACRIMDWVCSVSKYNGASLLRPVCSEKILNYIETENKEINCANRAILFCDALLSIGMFAIPIWLNNAVQNKNGSLAGHSHVIAGVWMEEEQHWATFDPSFNIYFQKAGKNIDISEMVNCVEKRKSFISVTNDSKKIINRAIHCTSIGLMDVSFLAGNDVDPELGYECEMRYHYVPYSYLEWSGKLDARYAYPIEKVVNIDYILQKPCWERQ